MRLTGCLYGLLFLVAFWGAVALIFWLVTR
jgi:hypothetical protein